MAKQPRVTIQVNSQQFQQFAQQFNAFSGQIKRLNASFAQISAAMNRTNLAIRAGQAIMRGFLTLTKSVGSEIGRITKKLLSWGTIVGGITALLGMGGGLFGIERLAASIMAKRRTTLGLGGDYGRTQAQTIFQQSLIGDPQGVMKNIRLGMAGAPDQMKALMGLGINTFGGTKMAPDEMMDQIVKKLPEILNRAGPGKELMMAQAYGLDKLFADPLDMLRLATKEGQKQYEMQRKLVEKYKDQLKISDTAQIAWTTFYTQLRAAGAQIETFLGEKLANLATPLQHLSEGFTRLVKALMDSPEVQKLINRLADWIDKLADQMKKLTTEDINKFITDIEQWLPTMEQLENAFTLLVQALKTTVNALNLLFPQKNPLAAGSQALGAGAIHDWLAKHLTPAGKALLGFDSGKKGASTTPFTTAPATTAPETTAPTNIPSPGSVVRRPPMADASVPASIARYGSYGRSVPATGGGGVAPQPPPFSFPATPAPAPAASAFRFGGGGGAAGGPRVPQAPAAGFNVPQTPGSTFGNWMQSSGRAPIPLASTPGNPVTTMLPQQSASAAGPSAAPGSAASFASTASAAAAKLVPKTGGGGPRRMPSPMGEDAPTMRGGPGPLSLNNWQMNRTTSLVVRNVPGANMFMTAAGMTG